MSLESDFGELDPMTLPPEQYREKLFGILITHARMTNAQLAESHVERKLLKKELAENTKVTNAISEDTALIREWLGNAKGFFRVIGILSRLLKWVLGLAVAISGAWFAYTHGGAPK